MKCPYFAFFFQIDQFFLHISNNHVGNSEGVSPGGDGPQVGGGQAQGEQQGVRISHQGVRHKEGKVHIVNLDCWIRLLSEAYRCSESFSQKELLES